MPAGRYGRVAALVVFAVVWVAVAVLLWRTTVPSLDLGGFDEHRFFSSHELSRAHDYEQGLHVIWLLATIASIVTLVVLMRVLPRSVRGIGLGRIGTAVIVGMVVLTTMWAVSLPFGVADLWWQHHWGLGPFDVGAWLDAQRSIARRERGVRAGRRSSCSSRSRCASGGTGGSPARPSSSRSRSLLVVRRPAGSRPRTPTRSTTRRSRPTSSGSRAPRA